MVGKEAEHRDDQDGVDDLHGSLRCSGSNRGDAPRSQRVTYQNDHGGQQGAEEQTKDAVRTQPLVPLFLGKVLEAPVVAISVHFSFQWPHEDEDQDGDPSCAPERHGHNQRAPVALEPQVSMRVHGGHVAIHTDAGHEADAHIDVGEENNPSDAAGDV